MSAAAKKRPGEVAASSEPVFNLGEDQNMGRDSTAAPAATSEHPAAKTRRLSRELSQALALDPYAPKAIFVFPADQHEYPIMAVECSDYAAAMAEVTTAYQRRRASQGGRDEQ